MTTKHMTLALTAEKDQGDLAICALNLAKDIGAHVAACYEDELGPIYLAPIDMVMPPVNYGAFFDALQDLRKEREDKARQYFDRATAVVGLPRVSVPSDGRPSAMWLAREGRQTCAFEGITDLVMIGSPGTNENVVTWNVLEHALFAARRRVLLVPPAIQRVSFARPMIAWNGSHEAENAVERCLDLVQPGAVIHIVQAGHLKPGRTPARRVMEYLQWHGFKSEFEDLGRRPGSVEDMLLRQAEAIHADCIIMGAYTHSRTRELLLGGVTDYMVRHSHIPLLMVH